MIRRAKARLLYIFVLIAGMHQVLFAQEVDDGAEIAKKPQNIVEATEFRLVDAEGKMRAKWAALEDMSMMAFMDENQNMRAGFGIALNGVALMTLCNDKGQSRTNITVNKEGHANIAMMIDEEKAAGNWSLDPEGRVAFEHRDPNGQLRQKLSVNRDGSAGLAMFDNKGELVSVYQVPADGGAGIVLYSPKHNEMRFSVTVDGKSGAPLLNIHRADGSPLATLTEVDGGGALAFNDGQGRQRGLIGLTPNGDAGVMVFDGRGNVISRFPQGFDSANQPATRNGEYSPQPQGQTRQNQSVPQGRGGRGGRGGGGQ